MSTPAERIVRAFVNDETTPKEDVNDLPFGVNGKFARKGFEYDDTVRDRLLRLIGSAPGNAYNYTPIWIVTASEAEFDRVAYRIHRDFARHLVLHTNRVQCTNGGTAALFTIVASPFRNGLDGVLLAGFAKSLEQELGTPKAIVKAAYDAAASAGAMRSSQRVAAAAPASTTPRRAIAKKRK